MAAGAVEVNITSNNSKACASFDGIDDLVNVPHTGVLALTTNQDFAISFWFKRGETAAATEAGLVNFRPAALRGIGVRTPTDGKINFACRNDGGEGTVSSDVTAIGVWTHILATQRASDHLMVLYKNGISQGTDTAVVTLVPTEGAIGGNRITGGTSAWYQGEITDVRIYGEFLGQAEATKLATNENIDNELIARWKLAKDYTDSAGDNDGTNVGTYLTIADDAIAAAIKADRTTANDKYIGVGLKGQFVSTVIEEAP
jgi:hypothetical protein